MVNEPERPIEKLLRAAAKKRRNEAGASFELHPSDRRRLQGEVSRKFAPPQRETRLFAEALRQLWPRFAWGIALLAVLAVAAWLLLPAPGNGHPAVFLAKNVPGSGATPVKEPPPQTPAAPATVASSPATAAKTMPPKDAYADMASPARAKPERQLAAAPRPLAEGSPAMNTREAGEKLAVAAAPQLADRQKQAGSQPAAPGQMTAQAPAGAVNSAFESRYGLARNPTPLGNLVGAPAAPSTIALAPPAANVTATNKSDVPAAPYKSLVVSPAANRLNQVPALTDGLSKGVPGVPKKALGNTVAQQYIRAAPGAKATSMLAGKPAGASPVLASFRVEQTGQALRIVDGDGSVYAGTFQLADASRRARSFKAEAPAVALLSQAREAPLETKPAPNLDADPLPRQSYFFRVSGTNRSVNQKVVFTGQLLTANNLALSPPIATNLGSVTSPGRSQTWPVQSSGLLLLNSRISGKVVVGSGEAVDISALPTSP